ncbi:MAG: HPr family phosphocarrier protein [Peptoniphilus sp.]
MLFEINLEAHSDKVNGKSIIGIMSLEVSTGEEIIIEADGVDEEEAVERLANLVEKEFINL